MDNGELQIKKFFFPSFNSKLCIVNKYLLVYEYILIVLLHQDYLAIIVETPNFKGAKNPSSGHFFI